MEMAQYRITRPSVYMHTSPAITGEVGDELLYGTELKKAGESGEYLRCETSYGYCGYVKKKYLTELKVPEDTKPYIVTASHCDVLTEAVYKYRPVITLPRGSIIHSRHILSASRGFFSVNHRNHKCYVPSSAVKPYKKQGINTIENEINFRKSICDDALFYLGTPYRWGGKSTDGIDCSGLCFMTYFINGLPLWRDSYADNRYVHEISAEKALPGDLIYFKGHMALYIGDGEFVHSSATAVCVTVNSLNRGSIIYRHDLATRILCFARSNLL